MKVLLLTRGAPGAGKSTFLKQNNLEPYALSADSIRLMFQSPILTKEGNFAISQGNNSKTWELLFQFLEDRMLKGEFIVVDATHAKAADLNRYYKPAKKHHYQVYCIDFTDTPLEICKQRNAARPEYKRVPEDILENIHSTCLTQKVPSFISTIKPSELNKIWYSPVDFSNYKKIHHIGDIHGCFAPLKKFLKDGINEDELYIFCGDYIDRGPESAETIKFLAGISSFPNVILLEGNHEHWLWCYANDSAIFYNEFNAVTRPQLEAMGITKKDCRLFYNALAPCAYYTYNDKTVFVSHGGLSFLPENLSFISNYQMIHGVGRYSDYISVAKSFTDRMPPNTYQVFGHRNIHRTPIPLTSNCFSLEGEVEIGGDLRIITFDQNGFYYPQYIKNTDFISG